MTACGLGWSIFRFNRFVLLMRPSGLDFAVCAVVWSEGREILRIEGALCSHRGDQRGDAHDVHGAFYIVGQHVQRHFGTDPFQGLHLEVR